MMQKVSEAVLLMMLCNYGHKYYSKSMDQPGKVSNAARGQHKYSPVRVRA